MPVPRDFADASLVYRLRRGDVPTSDTLIAGVEVGIGGRAQVSIAGALDARSGEPGPLELGAKLLLMMEDSRSIDFAFAVHFTTETSIGAALLAGRTLVPGIYLQADVGAEGVSNQPQAALVIHGAAGLQW